MSITPFFIDAPVNAVGLIKSGFSNVLKSLNLAEVIISDLVMPLATMLAALSEMVCLFFGSTLVIVKWQTPSFFERVALMASMLSPLKVYLGDLKLRGMYSAF